jgi:hypothetical protein
VDVDVSTLLSTPHRYEALLIVDDSAGAWRDLLPSIGAACRAGMAVGIVQSGDADQSADVPEGFDVGFGEFLLVSRQATRMAPGRPDRRVDRTAGDRSRGGRAGQPGTKPALLRAAHRPRELTIARRARVNVRASPKLRGSVIERRTAGEGGSNHGHITGIRPRRPPAQPS